MKKLIFIVIIILCYKFSSGQIDTTITINNKIKYGIEISYNFTTLTWNAYSISAVLRKENHLFLVGARIWVSPPSLGDKRGNGGGLEFSYKYFPNSENNRFSFYFLYNLDLSMIKWETSAGFNPWHPYSNYDIIRTTNTYVFSNILGYGFKVKIIDGVYLNNCVGAGIDISRDDITLSEPHEPSHHSLEKGNFDNIEFTALIKVGIGYNFKGKSH